MIRVEHSHWPVEAITHPGMTGKNNEDRFAVSAYRLSDRTNTPVLLAVLSDGIGGHRGGEVAAELAVTYISQRLSESTALNPLTDLRVAIQQASDVIYQQASTNTALQGMGATVACAWMIGTRLYTATVGDSRIYLRRGERILQLSTDHTWIQEAVERGLLRPEQAQGHPNAHIIRRFLGSPTPPEVDQRLRLAADEDDAAQLVNQGLPLLPGDQILLCSDGLTDLVPADEILAVLRQAESLRTALETLVALANQRGGHDNITAVLVQVVSLPSPWGALWRRLRWGCLGLLLAGLLSLMILIGLGLWQWRNSTSSVSPTHTVTVTPISTPMLPSVTPVLPRRPLP